MSRDEEQSVVNSFDTNDQKYTSLKNTAYYPHDDLRILNHHVGAIDPKYVFPLSLGYPLNLAFDVCVGCLEFSEEDIYSMSEDQRNGVDYAISILPEYVSERNKMILFARYRDLKTFAQIGREFNLTTERTRQIIKKILRMLRHSSRSSYIVFGRYGYENILNARRESRNREIENIIQNEKNQTKKPVIETSIDDIGLSVRAYNCLCRAGIRNISMLLDFLTSNEDELEIDFLKLGKIRNCGRKTNNEIANALMKIGVIREIKKDIHGTARYASVNYKYD